jgi:hypothetical protein
MFLVEHRFCSGPLDGKSSDPGDRIGVKSVVGCHGAVGSARSRQRSGWNDRAVRLAYVDEDTGIESHRERRRDDGTLFLSQPVEERSLVSCNTGRKHAEKGGSGSVATTGSRQSHPLECAKLQTM